MQMILFEYLFLLVAVNQFCRSKSFFFFFPRVNINLGLIFHSKLNINKFKNVYAVKVIAGNQIQLFEMMDVHQLKQFCNSEDCIPINEHLVKKKNIVFQHVYTCIEIKIFTVFSISTSQRLDDVLYQSLSFYMLICAINGLRMS